MPKSYTVDINALAKIPKPEAVKAVRHLLSQALNLDEPMSLTQFGHILGYDGKNVYAAVDKIERGKAGVSAVVKLRMAQLATAASPFILNHTDEYRWCEIWPIYSNEDTQDLHLDHKWFPRAEFVLQGRVSHLLYEELGFREYGTMKNKRWPDETDTLYVRWTDPLPNEEWAGVYLDKAAEIFWNMQKA